MNQIRLGLDYRLEGSGPGAGISTDELHAKPNMYVLSPDTTTLLGRQMVGHRTRIDFLEGPDALANTSIEGGIPAQQESVLREQLRVHSEAFAALTELVTLTGGAEVTAFPTENAPQQMEQLAA